MNAPAAKRGILTRLADVQPERVAWLWHGRIPLGKLTMLDGDPGLGKSTLTAALAAAVSTGQPLLGGPVVEPAGVVILSAEDGLADTIRPRLDAAGADVARVVALEVDEGDEHGIRPPVLPLDLDVLEGAIAAVSARLVVVDPIMAFLSAETNARQDQDVRRALAPLAALAERTGAAVLLVRHLNKATGASAIYRGGGSIGLIGAARSGLLVAKHPEDESRRVLASVKCNLALPPPALAFSITEAPNGAGLIRWEGAVAYGADALLTPPADEGERSATDEATAFLREALAAGPKGARDVQNEARQAGIGDKPLRTARERLGIKPQKQGMGGGWTWELPPKMPSTAEDAPVSYLGAFGHLRGVRASSGAPSPGVDPCPACAGPLKHGVCGSCADRPCLTCGRLTGDVMTTLCAACRLVKQAAD